MGGTPRACRFHPVSFPPCTIHSTNRRSDSATRLGRCPCQFLPSHVLASMPESPHRVMWYICTTWVSNPFITSPWYTCPLNRSPPARGKLSSMGRDSRKGPFLLLLLPICDDPGSGHRAGRAHPPAHHLRRPRQRDRAACRGCGLLVVLSPDGTLGNAMGLRSRMLE